MKYLKHVGYNGLMLSVLADGSSLFPSQLLEPTPRYDTGVFFASGQDPLRKDALEMYFRLFDREQLVLIPALQFASPLPEIEALKRSGGAAAVGLEWIDANGRPRRAADASAGAAYNLLNPHVQQAMLSVVREVVSRYAAHPSFGGVALQLSPETYAQLPAGPGGFDDETIARFEQATGRQVPGEGAERFAARARYFDGPGRQAWLDWRSRLVADFHRRLEREIVARHPEAKLYLAGGTMLEDDRLRLGPALPRRTKLDEVFEEIGLSMPAYARTPGIVLLRPQLMRPATAAPPAGAAEAEIYLSPEMDRLFAAQPHRASLFYDEPQKARLPGFDVESPFGAANTYTWLVAEMSPSGDRNRRRFVHSLAVGDTEQMFDGGWLLPLGQEEQLHHVLSVYRQLPGEPFQTVAGDFQPVTIRTLSRAGESYVYLVNDSPWSVDVAVQLDVPQNGEFEPLGEGGSSTPPARSGSRTAWPVKLKPYDVAAGRFTVSNVRVLSAAVTLPGEVHDSLQQRIEDLVSRVRALGQSVVENGGFEAPLAERQLTGWVAHIPAGGRVALDTRQFRSGKQSLMLTTGTQSVSVASAPFDPPSVGRIVVEAWLRTAGGEPPPAVRIAIEGQWNGSPFRPHGMIEHVGATARAPGDWVLYSFPIENLPTEGLSPLRVRFELVGPGEVWIDDVQVRPFSEPQFIELSTINSLASLHLEKRQYSDCARLLEGYWPQFLVAHVALTTATAGNTPLAKRPKPPAPAPAEPKKPSLFESMRGLIPQFH